MCSLRPFGWLLFLLVWLGVAGCDLSASSPPAPEARSGVMDLKTWDFARDGRVRLEGEWFFFWRQRLDPTDVSLAADWPDPVFIPVPGYWSGSKLGTKRFPSDGFGTYRLRVILPESGLPLALRIMDANCAYTLFINGHKAAENGRVGESREAMIPEYRPVIAKVPVDGAELDLIVQVSNFHHRDGGLQAPIQLGLEHHIRTQSRHRIAVDMFLAGIIFIMGMYHLALFLMRKDDRAPLYFGLFCCLITLRNLVMGERLLHAMVPSIGWETMLTLEYLTFYLAVPAFGLFVYSLFPQEFRKAAVRVFQGVGGGFSLLVALTPARIFTHTLQVYQLITLAAGVYIIIVLVLAYRRQREGVILFLVGFSLFFVSVINDILYHNDVLKGGYWLSIGVFAFIFIQAIMLSLRFSKSLLQVESQKAELLQTNQALSSEIGERRKLEIDLRQSHQQFQDSRIALILGLAKLAEYRDEDTGLHLERMREYAKILARELARRPQFKGYITDDYVVDIYQSAILHDIGKVGIRDSILLKPGRLTKEEFAVMKQHATIGGDAIRQVEAKMRVQSFLTLGRDIAYYHHEKWDGSGYPEGRRGDDIPLSARITALADVYDALTSARPYKEAFSHEKARAIITGDSGRHFDPEVVDAFEKQLKLFDTVRKTLLD